MVKWHDVEYLAGCRSGYSAYSVVAPGFIAHQRPVSVDTLASDLLVCTHRATILLLQMNLSQCGREAGCTKLSLQASGMHRPQKTFCHSAAVVWKTKHMATPASCKAFLILPPARTGTLLCYATEEARTGTAGAMVLGPPVVASFSWTSWHLRSQW